MQKKIDRKHPSFLTKGLENCWTYLRPESKVPRDFGTFLNSAVTSAEHMYFLQEKCLEQIKLDVVRNPEYFLQNIEFELCLLKGALLPLTKETDAIDTLMFPRVDAQHLLRKVLQTITEVKKLGRDVKINHLKTRSLVEEKPHFAGGRVLSTSLSKRRCRMKVITHLN